MAGRNNSRFAAAINQKTASQGAMFVAGQPSCTPEVEEEGGVFHVARTHGTTVAK